MKNSTYLRVDTSRLASLCHQTTTGIYTVYRRGTTEVLCDFLNSPEEAADWCKRNGWELPPKPSVPISKLDEIATTIAEWGWESTDAGHAIAQGAAKLIREAIAEAESKEASKG